MTRHNADLSVPRNIEAVNPRVPIAIVLLACVIIAGACSKSKDSRDTAQQAPNSLRPVAEEHEDDPDARSDWFFFQRTYPGNTVPPDARRKAWERVLEARSQPRLQSEESESAATGWRAIGPSPTLSHYSNIGQVSGRINAIAVSPANSRVVLVGGSTGGIWRSTDSGNSFTPVSDNQADLAVGSIVFSRSNPAIVYAGMGDTKVGYLGTGILKSTDEGVTWRRVSNSSLPSPGTIARVEVDPANANRVYVAQYSRLDGNTIEASGIYVSTDGGVNWTLELAGAARDVVVDAGNSQTIYAGLSRIDPDVDPPFGVYRSTDRGATWVNVFTGPSYSVRQRRDIRIGVSADDPQRILVYFGGVLGGLDVRFASSTDGGTTWAQRPATGFDIEQIGYNTYLAVDPRNANTIYVGSRDLYRSTDGGSTWANLTRSFSASDVFYEYTPTLAKSHADQHAFAFVPNSSSQFYIGNDGGIWRTADGGATFQSLNSSLSLGQFTGVSLHPTDPNISFGGTQDNGTQRRLSGSDNWFEFNPGDGGHSVINPLDPAMVFVTYVRGNIFRFVNNGLSFDAQLTFDSNFGEFGIPRMAFYPPFVGNGSDSTLYFGTWRLFVSTNLGNSWFPPAGDTDFTKGITTRGSDVLSAIGVSSSNSNIIYTGSVQGRAMASSDGGVTWRDVTQGLPDRAITSVTSDPANQGTAYLTVSGFGTGHVFRTSDSGATWTNISSGLPDIPANCFLIDPIDPQTFYLGTDIGVFRSTDRGATWRDFNRGIPPVIIHQFSAQSSGLIQVATYGRGIYEIVGNERPSIESAEFDGKKKLTINGRGFGESPQVLVNGVDRTSKISSSSATSIKLKGKGKKIGLATGDNMIQVINENTPSLVFTLRL